MSVEAAEFRASEERSELEQAEDAWWIVFGASVREARKSCGLRQDELAARLGLTRSSIANIESGRQRASAYFAARLVAELGMTVPGWQVDPEATVLARQLAQARRGLMDALTHTNDAARAARAGLG